MKLPKTLHELYALRNDDVLQVVRHTKEVRKIIQETADQIAREGRQCSLDSELLGWFVGKFSRDVDAAQARKEKADAEAVEATRRAQLQAAQREAASQGAEIAKQILQEFPCIVRTRENLAILGDALDDAGRKHPELIPDFETAVSIFKKLARSGKLYLSPKLAGTGSEIMLTPAQTRKLAPPRLEAMLVSESEKEAGTRKAEQGKINSQSASEFRQEYLKDAPDVSRAVWQSEESAENNINRQLGSQALLAVTTFLSNHPEYEVSVDNKEKIIAWLDARQLGLNLANLNAAFDALKSELELKPIPKAGITKHVAYDTSRNQDPTAAIDNAALRRLVAKMPSGEFAEWYRNATPKQRAVIDGTNQDKKT
jgi:hypothetical protein